MKFIIFALTMLKMVIIYGNIRLEAIINITELSVMEPINLNPSCSITSFVDFSNNLNYSFISTFGINDVISNIYNEYFIEYNSSSLIIDGYNNPMSADVTTFKNNFSNILLCYSGSETNDTHDDNKYIYCKIFYNISLISNNIIVNKPNQKDLMCANYPQTISQNNLFIIFYSKYFTMENNYISYSIININNKQLLINDMKLNITHPSGVQPGILNVISSSFNNSLFLITMTYYNFYKLIGWIGYYNNDNYKINILNTNYFQIVDNINVLDFTNYGKSISLNITQDCCFITPYFTNVDINTNKLYLTIFDINGIKILNNDTYISLLNNVNICGAIKLTMINGSESELKYFLIYAITNHQIIGYIFTVQYQNDKYSLNYINNVNLQNNTQTYRNACFSILNDKLCMVSFVADTTSNPKIFGQSWKILNN